MDIIDLLKLKLRNDLLKDLCEYEMENLEEQIDNKINSDLFKKEKDKDKDKDKKEVSLSEKCCARIMGERYSDERCPYRRVKGDYCRIHLKRIDNYGYLAFNRYDESRPLINEKGNKIAWRDNSAMDDINTVIKYQNIKLCKYIK